MPTCFPRLCAQPPPTLIPLNVFWFCSDAKNILPKLESKDDNLVSENPGTTRRHLLFLCLVRLIVEKHGGHLHINDNNETFTVTIPEEQKSACFRELKDAVGPLKKVRECFVPFQ